VKASFDRCGESDGFYDTFYCPFAIADFLKLNFRGMLCILRCEGIFAHEVQLLSSSRIGSILTERGEHTRRIALSQQAEESVGKSERVIITERVDDVARLIGQMGKMGLPEVVDRHLPRHGKARGRSWGWTAVMWLASLLPEGDHRKVSVAAYITGMHHTLSHLRGPIIAALDFRDDRLGPLLKPLSTRRSWPEIERDFNARSREVYAWPQDLMRCEATTVSGHHAVTEGGLGQFGQRKDDPTRPHIKVMMGSLAPLGLPRSTEVRSGERADDG